MNALDYGFVKVDKDEFLEGVLQAFRYERDSIVVANIGDPLIDQLEDFVLSQDGAGALRILQMHFGCKYLLLTWQEQDEIKMVAFSDEKRVRAIEFLDYLNSPFGLVKGDAICATGRLSSAILKVQMSGMDLNDVTEYFLFMVDSYFTKCDWIDAKNYEMEHKNEIEEMCRYRKKHVAWAFVWSTDIVPIGEQIKIKSLENESGLTITAAKDVLIMIGCRGEVYDIKKTKFEETYVVSDEPLDIFGRMLDYLPEVCVTRNGRYVMLDEIARICYPKPKANIKAKQIDKRTKVFPKDGNQEYYLGRVDDYLAVRIDDYEDVYIVQKEIFEQTYEVDE